MTIYDLNEYHAYAVECFHGGMSNLSLYSNTLPRTAMGLQEMTVRVMLTLKDGRTPRVLLLVELW